MALQKQGSKVIAKLTDLTQESALYDGDRIVFWCSTTGEAATIDYGNIKIDEDHTTFGDTFKEVVNFATTASAWIQTVQETFDEINEKLDEAIESTTGINNDILAMKMMIKMILGLATARTDLTGNFTEQQYVDTLPDEAKTIYQTMRDEVLTAAGLENFDFTRQNIIFISTI